MKRLLLLGFLLAWCAPPVQAQLNIGGDFRLRGYYDSYEGALDERPSLNYLRYLGRLNASGRVAGNTSFLAEFTTVSDNDLLPVRTIAATGGLFYGVSQLFAQTHFTDVLGLDLLRLRAGRQQFPIGRGLSQGESVYFLNNFDGFRADASIRAVQLSLFGAITSQNLSASGLFPAPGGDRLFIGRAATTVLEQDVMSYLILNSLDGSFNDSYIVGAGGRGSFLSPELEYFWEAAHQRFHRVPGFPEMGGTGYMAGLGYRRPVGPFRWVKIEARHAAYQGDDAATERVERFSPLYPSFFWGDRAGFANAVIGGDFPHDGRELEGSRIWYARLYFVPYFLAQSRLQFQYVMVDEFVDNDGYNSMDDELSIRFYYRVSANSRAQLRFARRIPNEEGFNPATGIVSSTTDRFALNRFMIEWHVRF